MSRFDQSDRDRVLMNIASDTAGTVHDQMYRLRCGWNLRFTFDHPSPQFIPEEMAKAIGMPLAEGDIIRCNTNPNHRWGISEFVSRRGYADFLLREIGGDKLLNMGNESVSVLRFMERSRLYAGAKYRVYKWATFKAFEKPHNPDADNFKRCGGVEFDGSTLTIWCRPHIWVAEKQSEDGDKLYAQPKKFTMQWDDKTKLKDIVSAMRSQGFADHFEYAHTEPTQGQQGYAKFTRDDMLRIIPQAMYDDAP
jgi:hypothetical protein